MGRLNDICIFMHGRRRHNISRKGDGEGGGGTED